MKIPLGDILRRLKLPGWLRAVLGAVQGTSVKVGGHDILLDEDAGATSPRTGLDQPHRMEPPKFGGPRR